MSEFAIKVNSMSKRYRIGLKNEIHDTLSGAFFSWIRSPISNFRRVQKLSTFKHSDDVDIIWAIKEISFDVKHGEVLGIIGENGAGKSTLLKILARITAPTLGFAKLSGRVASLLEVGTGFHQELTGRENVYLNGTILGMTKNDIDRNFDEIVEFSGVEKFIDTPVKRFSSGMKVRLAFAVAAHLEPEILLIDEVLAVGDIGFRKKCLGKVSTIAEQGRTVIFVTHSMSALSSLCPRTILLHEGKKLKDGKTSSVIRDYLSLNAKNETEMGDRDAVLYKNEKSKDGKFVLHGMRTLDENRKEKHTFLNNENVTVEVEFMLNGEIKDLVIGIDLIDNLGTIILRSYHNDIDEILLKNSQKKVNRIIRTVIPKDYLNGGVYTIVPHVHVYNKYWIIKNINGLMITILFDTPNPDHTYPKEKRPQGIVAPILKWETLS